MTGIRHPTTPSRLSKGAGTYQHDPLAGGVYADSTSKMNALQSYFVREGVAEREGFEPSMGLPPNRISNAAP